MIKHIIFDLGRVLVEFDPDLFIKRLHLNNKADEQLLLEKVFHSKEWPMTDSGELSEAEACALMCHHLPLRLHPLAQQLVLDWYKPLILIDGMTELTHELKENGYDLYLLSNAGLLQNDYWPNVPCSKYFSGKITSAEERLVKPDPALFQRLFTRFKLKPDECIFVDDSLINCEGAERCGMRAIQFINSTQTREELRKHGIQC